jgi:hypothetical protein
MEDFYQNVMWAGRGWENTSWPIVDTKTCGEIDGEPREDQIYCIAFSHESQAHICKLLNNSEKIESQKEEGEINNKYFGYGCKFFIGQWELCDVKSDIEHTEYYKEFEPDLVFCNHPDNKEQTEGNCREDFCPLKQ